MLAKTQILLTLGSLATFMNAVNLNAEAGTLIFTASPGYTQTTGGSQLVASGGSSILCWTHRRN